MGMDSTKRTSAAVSATQAGRAQIARCPPALMSATTMDDVWTGSACAIRATRETTAASWRVPITAMIRDSV